MLLHRHKGVRDAGSKLRQVRRRQADNEALELAIAGRACTSKVLLGDSDVVMPLCLQQEPAYGFLPKGIQLTMVLARHPFVDDDDEMAFTLKQAAGPLGDSLIPLPIQTVDVRDLDLLELDEGVFVRLDGNESAAGIGPEEFDNVVDHFRLDLMAAAVVRDALRGDGELPVDGLADLPSLGHLGPDELPDKLGVLPWAMGKIEIALTPPVATARTTCGCRTGNRFANTPEAE
jgi:hypothetical protein